MPAALMASDSKAARQSLKGLTAMSVDVEYAKPKKDIGIDPAKIATNVEGKLKAAGIKVLTRDEALKAPGAPHLIVNLDAVEGKDGTVSFGLTLAVAQGCTLARDPNVKVPSCECWSRGKVGRANSGVPAFIDGQIASEVDNFVAAYTDVNPKK